MVNKPFSITDDYLSGIFWAFNAYENSWLSFSAVDYGQYPWGRDRDNGTLAELCTLLGWESVDKSSNCCLIIHLLTALFDLGLTTVNSLVTNHEVFLRKHLISKTMRCDDEVVPELLTTLKLRSKIAIRFIFLHEDGIFYICTNGYGDPKGTGIFVAFCRNHFFLAEPFVPPN